jgi:flagellar protein FliL
MKSCLLLFKYFSSVFLLACLLQVPTVLASDHGGGASGPTPQKFIVNLGDPSNGGKYLQVQMVFEPAVPEAEHLLAVYQPKIQHALILLLSSKDAATLLTLQGKKDLMGSIIQAVNQQLHETEKTGVKEVFFTSFIIQ